jgi:hypothetical protein
MLDFNLYYAQTTADAQRRQARTGTERATKRVLQLPSRRAGREGSAR